MEDDEQRQTKVDDIRRSARTLLCMIHGDTTLFHPRLGGQRPV